MATLKSEVPDNTTDIHSWCLVKLLVFSELCGPANF